MAWHTCIKCKPEFVLYDHKTTAATLKTDVGLRFLDWPQTNKRISEELDRESITSVFVKSYKGKGEPAESDGDILIYI